MVEDPRELPDGSVDHEERARRIALALMEGSNGAANLTETLRDACGFLARRGMRVSKIAQLAVARRLRAEIAEAHEAGEHDGPGPSFAGCYECRAGRDPGAVRLRYRTTVAILRDVIDERDGCVESVIAETPGVFPHLITEVNEPATRDEDGTVFDVVEYEPKGREASFVEGYVRTQLWLSETGDAYLFDVAGNSWTAQDSDDHMSRRVLEALERERTQALPA